MTTSTDASPFTTELTNLAKQLAAVLADKNELEQQEKFLKSCIRALVPGPDSYAAGDLTVSVSANNRFDQGKALPLIPADLLPLVTRTETVVDTDKLKALLPDVFEQAQTVGEHRIALK